MLCGSRSGLGTESKAMLGTVCCASAGDAASSNRPISARFMKSSQDVFGFLMGGGC
jgi:hypothetical protein